MLRFYKLSRLLSNNVYDTVSSPSLLSPRRLWPQAGKIKT